jgi:hypothetical protein
MAGYIEVPPDADANKMIKALLNYLVNQKGMEESTAKDIVKEGMK